MEGMITIYAGGFIPDLAICNEGPFQGWLFAKHPDGQWVSLAKLPPPADSPRCTEEAGQEAAHRMAVDSYVQYSHLAAKRIKALETENAYYRDHLGNFLMLAGIDPQGLERYLAQLAASPSNPKREAVALEILTSESLPPGTIALIQDGKVTGGITNLAPGEAVAEPPGPSPVVGRASCEVCGTPLSPRAGWKHCLVHKPSPGTEGRGT